jgi:uncharacterized SAM-binding protein YcdF (DUF218 family)
MAAGALTTLVAAWLLSPLPLFIDEPLVVNDAPARAAAIVCLGGGTIQGLPGASGWARIATALRLYRAGFAPVVLFSGGAGHPERSEAEIYAEAARSLGLPADVIRTETRSAATFEHPRRLSDAEFVREHGGREASLIVVTSPYHGRRVLAVFRKAGYTGVRVVTAWGRGSSWIHGDDDVARAPGQKIWERVYRLLYAAREWTALCYYRVRGWI